MNSIQKSLVYIKKEQIAIMIKEILHLKHILIFYKGENIENDMSISFKNLQEVESKLIKLKYYLKIFEDGSISNDYPKFIMLYDYIGRHIHDSLHIVELIYQRVNQVFEEGYNQYIPKPILGRRFSNNNLMITLKKNYQDIISTLFTKKENFDLILSWSFKNYFQLEYSHNNFMDNNYGNYINLPYWYYEIPILLPSITHECGRVSLLQKDSKIDKFRELFRQEIKDFLRKNINSSTLIEEEIILQREHHLVEKVLSDIIGYIIYDKAYIYSIFHDTIGLGIAELFEFKDNNKKFDKKDFEKENKKNGDEYFHDYFDNKMSSWKFEPRKDITIIRLHILLSLLPKGKDKTINEMQNLLNGIILIDDKYNSSYSFKKLYEEKHPHYKQTYIKYSKAYSKIINMVLKWIKKTSIQKKLKNILSSLPKESKIDFLYLWEQRFEKLKQSEILHKNEFRKLLHKETLKKIEKLAGSSKGIGDPYVLTFTKLQKKFNCDNIDDCNTGEGCLDCSINNHFDKKLNYHSFGIYDLFKCRSTIKDTQIDKHLEILENKLNTQNEYNKKSKKQDKPTKKIKYYESKFSLMQIFPDIEGTYHDNRLNVSLMYNIELHQSENKTYLYNALKEISEKLYAKKEDFSKAVIFKSLGPKDIIILIEGVSSKDLLIFNPELASLNCTKRTFTTVISKLDEKQEIKPNNKYNILSYLRIKHYSGEEFREELKGIIDTFKGKRYIKEVLLISGVMDIQIIWKKDTQTATIVTLYDLLMKKGLVTDFQTKFNKILTLES